METPTNSTIDLNQALTNIHNVIEYHFIGKKQDHAALQRSMEVVVETISSLESQLKIKKGLEETNIVENNK